MFSSEILFLGLALAIDAAVVTFAIGLLARELTPAQKLYRGVMTSLAFGLFQFGMIWLGSYGGYLFSFSKYGYLFQFMVGAIFVILALKLIQESLKDEEIQLSWGIAPIIFLSLATSLDALAAGISLGTLPNPHYAATEVGIITIMVCLGFYFMSQVFKSIPEKWLLRLAAAIFLFLGSQILYELVNKGRI